MSSGHRIICTCWWIWSCSRHLLRLDDCTLRCQEISEEMGEPVVQAAAQAGEAGSCSVGVGSVDGEASGLYAICSPWALCCHGGLSSGP